MAIYSLLQNSAFTPEQIKQMCLAYEAALAELKLSDRNDPLTSAIAKAIIEAAEIGERSDVHLLFGA